MTTVVDSQGNSTANSIAPLLTKDKKAEINADFAITQAFIYEFLKPGWQAPSPPSAQTEKKSFFAKLLGK